LKVKYQIVLKNVFQSLKDAVDDYINIDGGDVTGMYILTIAGAAIDLNDITVPLDTDINGIRIKIKGAPNIDIPLEAVGLMNPSFMPMITMMGMNINIPVPGSENWLFGGPLRENVWPPKPGTDPIFSTTQYYTLDDGTLDGISLTFALSIVYALHRIGLSKIANYFVSKLLSKNTIAASHEVADILTNTNTILTNIGTAQSSIDSLDSTLSPTGPSLKTFLSGLNSVINAIKAVIDKVDIQLLFDNPNDQLQTLIKDDLAMINEWSAYIESYASWLQSPSTVSRPVRPF
jgi:hypothetical protein